MTRLLTLKELAAALSGEIGLGQAQTHSRGPLDGQLDFVDKGDLLTLGEHLRWSVLSFDGAEVVLAGLEGAL